jgi:hypothetical protein
MILTMSSSAYLRVVDRALARPSGTRHDGLSGCGTKRKCRNAGLFPKLGVDRLSLRDAGQIDERAVSNKASNTFWLFKISY